MPAPVAEIDLRLLPMPQTSKLAIVSRSLLLREAVARRLSLLGVRTAAVSDFEALARELDGGRPSLALIDGDGWEQPWTSLVGGLRLADRGLPALLLVVRLSVEQVLEATSLGIRTVLLKPFKPEEHTARIHDLLLGAQGRTARRAHPRYFLPEAQRLEMEILPEGDWVARRLPLLDISAGGARLGLPGSPDAARLVPGSRWAVASLAINGAAANISFRVVHRARRSIGVCFEQLIDRTGVFHEALRGLDRSVFGFLAPKRAW